MVSGDSDDHQQSATRLWSTSNDQQMSLVQNELLNRVLCDLPSGEAIGWKDPTRSQAFITPSLRR